METNFELLNSIKYLISTGKSLKQVSVLLNLDLNYVKYLSQKIKTDIIHGCISEEFYLVPIIDKLLNKKFKFYNKFPYEHQYKIIDMLYLSDEEIVKKLNINMPRLLNFLKAMYFMLSVYDISGVDKSYLPIIKQELIILIKFIGNTDILILFMIMMVVLMFCFLMEALKVEI